jgi:hypothetical protein
MKDLEDCIHKQICSLSVILQIMNLPTRLSQTKGLQEKSSVFQESRSSAMSLRDTETSTLRGGGDVVSTVRAPSIIMTSLSQLPQFDFDEMLLTSQVYLRNRNNTLAMNSRTTGAGKMRDARRLSAYGTFHLSILTPESSIYERSLDTSRRAISRMQ